jgi:hypothetical protein
MPSLITAKDTAVLVTVQHKNALQGAINNIVKGRAMGVPAQSRPVFGPDRRPVVVNGVQQMEQVTSAVTATDYEEALGELAPVFSTTLAVLNTTPEKLAQINAILAAE